jgi:predicted phosphoribosyltransferase
MRIGGAERIVLAVPVIARTSAEELRRHVDELVAVLEPTSFYAVGQFYQRFEQTTDEEVRHLLSDAGGSGM